MRFIIIVNNKIVAERIGKEICNGEIECDGSYGVVGSELIDGVWVYVEPTASPSELDEAQATQTMTLINMMEDIQSLQVEIDALKGV